MNVAEMYRLNSSGKMTARQIADKEGTTRNAVLGKIYRYKRKAGISQDLRASNDPTRGGKKTSKKYKPKSAEVGPLNKELEDLKRRECRFPYGDGPFVFCGHKTRDRSSYCEEHHALCSGGLGKTKVERDARDKAKAAQ